MSPDHQPIIPVMFRLPRVWEWLVAIGLSVSLGSGQTPGCDSSPCPNSVPCPQCTGTWADDYGGTWSITSNSSNRVSGSVYVDLSYNPYCYNQSYTVSGSISPVYGSGSVNGYTTINITATDPYPGSTPGCTVASRTTLTGNVENDGCDLIPGDATIVSDIGSAMTSFSKSADFSSGQTDDFRVWSPGWPTIGQWQGDLKTTTDLDGRQVSESQPGDSTDSCWFSGSAYDKAGLSGGWWNVGFYSENAWNDDYVGWLPEAVTYYRANTTIPCEADIPQEMLIGVDGSGGSVSSYFFGNITWWIGTSQVGSGKNGNLQKVTWP